MRSGVDSSLLMALLYDDDRHNEHATDVLTQASEKGGLFSVPIVRSEIAAHPHFETEGDLEAFFSDIGLATDHPSSAVSFRAGKAFQHYLDRRGKELQCPACGHETVFECPTCDEPIAARQHIPADFIIGAHAEQQCDQLLSFDDGFYRDYFDVEIRTVAGP